MYVIRAPGPTALEVTFSDVVTTGEGLRAISQAFALADAGSVTSALCDLSRVRQGPGNYLELAVALAARVRPGMRIAFVIGTGQRPFVRRLARFSGVRQGLGLFETQTDAARWLRDVRAERPTSSVRRRHYEDIARPRTTKTGPQRRSGAA